MSTHSVCSACSVVLDADYLESVPDGQPQAFVILRGGAPEYRCATCGVA